MSEQSLKAIHDAIQAHYTEMNGDGAVLTDWFVGYGGMISNPEADDGISHPHGYCSSMSSPFGAFGVANMAVLQLAEDLSPEYEE